MIWLLNYISRFWLISVLLLSGCVSSVAVTGTTPLAASGSGEMIAVLPVYNLSSRGIPSKEIRQAICDKLEAKGIKVWNDDTFERFLLANRIRYTGGVDAALARSLRNRGGVRGILVTTVELYEGGGGPKISITSRLVSVKEKPEIEWIDSVALTGYDNPGILELGKIRDIMPLRSLCIDRLVSSLKSYFSGATQIPAPTRGGHEPKIRHRRESIGEIATGRTILVLPFTNDSIRKHSDEIMQLHMTRQLFLQGFQVVEPGIVRDELLKRRMIFDRGVSIPQADLLMNAISVDFIMGGTVQIYDDLIGEGGRPEVNFSAYVIALGDTRIVWSASFRNNGDEGVYFYDWHKILTASDLASSMSASAVESFKHNRM